MAAPSIRMRLTVWNGAVLGAILVGLGVAVYLLMAHELLDRIDASLAFEYAEVAERLRGRPVAEGMAELPSAFRQTYLIRIEDRGGRTRLETPALAGIALPTIGPGPRVARPTVRTARLGRLGPHRVLSGAVEGTGEDLVVRIATPLTGYDRELAELRAALLAMLPAGLLAAVAAGYGLAGRALEPVHRMTEAARRISAENLHERLDVVNPGDELGRLAATLNAMLDRLDRNFAAMKQFTADASHELKTPLAAIRTEAEVALQSPRSAEGHEEVLRSVVEEADRLARLADRLLLLSREDAGLVGEPWRPIRLDEVVRAAADHARGPAERAGVSLRVDGLPAATVAADPDRLRQVFDNLLDNAIKYNRPGGSVAVAGRSDGGRAVVEVRDTGIGIPTDALGRVFDRFFRVDLSRSRRTGGVGLGLSIARALVVGVGGYIEVESEPGRGSTFRVLLPLSGPG